MDTSTESGPILVTVPEAARRLSIGRTLTYELIAANELPVVRIGRTVRVPVSAIDEFVARRLGAAESDVETRRRHEDGRALAT